MKKTLYTLLACSLSVGMTQAEDTAPLGEEVNLSMEEAAAMHLVPLALPMGEANRQYAAHSSDILTGVTIAGGKVSSVGGFAANVASASAGKAAKDNSATNAVFVLANNASQSGAAGALSASGDAQNEGILRTDDNGLTCITLYARSARAGETAAIVLDGSTSFGTAIAAGSKVTSILFSIDKVSADPSGKGASDDEIISAMSQYWTTLGVYDVKTGALVSADTFAADGSDTGAATSMTLSLGDDFTWSDDYRIIATITGSSGGNWNNSVTFSGIKLTVIPEPATAALGLLALAGLATRRRRK